MRKSPWMESVQDRADYPRYLLRLCELERIDRERRNVERRIRLARFPQTKSFDTFDFAAQPSLNKALVLEHARVAVAMPLFSCQLGGLFVL
jgi:DNA replication protein DnaC